MAPGRRAGLALLALVTYSGLMLSSPAVWTATEATCGVGVSTSQAEAIAAFADTAGGLLSLDLLLQANTAAQPGTTGASAPATQSSGYSFVADTDLHLWLAIQVQGGGDPGALSGEASLLVAWAPTL